MKGISPENLRDLILTVGIHKAERPLSPIEVAVLINTALNAGTTINEVSQESLLSEDMVRRFNQLTKLPAEIRHLVDWGRKLSKISFSAAVKIASLKLETEQVILGEATLEHGFSKKEVIEIVENRNRIGKPIDICIEETLKMRPQIIKKYLFIGSIKSQVVREGITNLSQKERDLLLKTIINSNLPGLPSWGGTLGENRFSIVGDEVLYQSLNSLPNDFATIINGYLKSELLKSGQS
ncbi:hypothetical protein ACFLWT_00325 [Chloroflexota bacterium]